MIRCIALVSVAVLLTGCKPIKDAISQAFYVGTLEGMGTCLEGMRTDLISVDSAKAFCSSQYAVPLPLSALYALTGNAGPEAVWSEKLFTGTLQNETVGYVVTEVSIAVDVYEKDGKTKKTHEVSVQGWFEPTRAAQNFKSLPIQGAPDDWGQAALPFCPTPRTGRCWEWNIMNAKGLAL